MGDVLSSLWATVRIIGPACWELSKHRDHSFDPWSTIARREYIWRVGHHSWARRICENIELQVTVSGLAKFDHRERFVVVSNHASWLDIVVITYAIPNVFAFGCKKELLSWPLVGHVIKDGGQIILDRNNRHQAIRALKDGVSTDLGSSVLIFPEGTRTRDGKLLPFKKGAFRASQSSGMRILPVGIRGSFEALPKGPLWRYDPKVPVEVRFGRPISPNGKNLEEFIDETQGAVQRLLG